MTLIAVAPAIAAAQPGFGRVANLPYSGGVTVINNMKRPLTPADALKSGNLSVTGTLNTSPASKVSAPVQPRTVFIDTRPLLIGVWQQLRPAIVDSALSFLHERNIGGGFRTSRNRLTLAEDGPMFVGWDGRGFTIKFLLNGNSLSTYLRTPTPVSRDADPGFQVNFDLEVDIDVEVKGNQLVAGPARIQPIVHRPTGRNFTGALAIAVSDLVGVLSGTDFAGSFLKQINSRDFGMQTGLNQGLARLNPVLRAAASGGTIMPGYDAGRSSITLTMQNAGPLPVVR
ncbi:MAG: hypothetical protein ACSLFK_02315 [Gemmatimonadaceae bacterium]